jgi:redox-sensitive bicupin YhaK (pirin superfamily)
MTWHSFSFGSHYDPDRVAFGPMVCHDEHLLADGRGFDTHHHEGLEILTWVLSGALAHTDSLGGAAELRPGAVGHLSAGEGVEHAEIAAAPQTRFVQVWLTAEDPARPPVYEIAPVSLADGSFTSAARPRSDAELGVVRLDAGQTVTVPAAARRHLFVATGALLRNSLAEPLVAGDAFLITEDSPGPIDVTAAVPSELLLWSFT